MKFTLKIEGLTGDGKIIDNDVANWIEELSTGDIEALASISRNSRLPINEIKNLVSASK